MEILIYILLAINSNPQIRRRAPPAPAPSSRTGLMLPSGQSSNVHLSIDRIDGLGFALG